MGVGISPLMATVILIGLVVVFSATFIIWGSEFTDVLTGKTEKRAERDLSCAEDIDLDVLDACYECGNNDDNCNIKIKLRNNKDVDLSTETFKLKLETEMGNVVVPNIATTLIKPLDIKSITTNYPNNIGVLKSLVIVPKLNINGESAFCGPLPEVVGIKEGC